MAITTLDGVVAGLQTPQYFAKFGTGGVASRFTSFFIANGIPGKAVISTAGLGGEALTSYPGKIPFTNAPVGQKSYLAKFLCGGTGSGIFMLCDRVWHNNGFNVTTTGSQAFTGCPNFDRDINNAAGVGEGIYIGVEHYSAVNSAGSINVTYTNSAGVSGRTGTLTLNSSMVATNFTSFTLAAEDTGVRSIQSAAITTAAASGTLSFVAYRPIALIGFVSQNASASVDALTSGFPEIYNNSVLFVVGVGSSAGVSLVGSLAVTQG